MGQSLAVKKAEPEKAVKTTKKAEAKVEEPKKVEIKAETAKKAELPNIRFHDLRHTFATHALTSGVDAKSLSGLLGHTKASFTLDTYTHITTEMQKNAADIVGVYLEDIFGKDLKPWLEEEKTETELSDSEATDDGKADISSDTVTMELL